MRKMRQADGHQAGTLRKIPCLLRLSRMQKHKGDQKRAGESGGEMPGMREGRNCKEIHQKEAALLRLLQVAGLQIRQLEKPARKNSQQKIRKSK